MSGYLIRPETARELLGELREDRPVGSREPITPPQARQMGFVTVPIGNPALENGFYSGNRMVLSASGSWLVDGDPVWVRKPDGSTVTGGEVVAAIVYGEWQGRSVWVLT